MFSIYVECQFQLPEVKVEVRGQNQLTENLLLAIAPRPRF